MKKKCNITKIIYKIVIIIILLILIFSNSIKVYAAGKLSINAKASLIVEVNSDKIIYENNAYIKNYPASITKILTAILVLEKCDLNDIVTESKSAISNIPNGYVTTPLFEGEQIRVIDLLYALMLRSANDAAYILAEHVGGSINGFSELMNKKAQELGCKNSHFVNPNGIHNPNHYTTAYDMYLITKYAIKNESFIKITSTSQYVLPATNKYSKNDRIMKNTNFFVNPDSKYYNKDVKGIKTGTTLQAGNCLITYIEKNGLNIITVVLGAENTDSKFIETNNMINYTFNNYAYETIHKKGDIIKNIIVDNATKETQKLNVVIDDDIVALNNINSNSNTLNPEINIDSSINAPVYKGQEVGSITYNIDGLEYTAKLIADSNVIKKTYYFEMLIGGGIILVLLCIIILILTIKLINKKESQEKYEDEFEEEEEEEIELAEDDLNDSDDNN